MKILLNLFMNVFNNLVIFVKSLIFISRIESGIVMSLFYKHEINAEEIHMF
jgi:hypothetical protein